MQTPSPSSKPPIDLRLVNGEVWLSLRVQPKASRNRLTVEPDGRVKASITAPPAGGAANAALCELLANELNVPKSAVRVVRGEKSRDKTVAIRGLNESEVSNVLLNNP